VSNIDENSSLQKPNPQVNHTQDGDSAMRITKAPTDNSVNWMKSVSGVSGSKTAREAEQSPQVESGIINLDRLQSLGLGKLAEKVG